MTRSTGITSLRSASIGKMAARFFSWWRSELAELIPASVSSWWQGANRTVLVHLADTRIIIEREVAGEREKLAEIDTKQASLSEVGATAGRVLQNSVRSSYRALGNLDKERVFRRTIVVPFALEENLRQALGFEIDRYTPFKLDQVYFDFRILHRDPSLRRLTIDLGVVSRVVIDHDLERLDALGLKVQGFALSDEAFTRNPLTFAPAAIPATSLAPRSLIRLGLGMTAGLLLVVLLAIPPWQKRTTAISLIAPLDAAKQAARETDRLRDRLDALVIDHNLLPERKWRNPSSLIVLEELSKLLADGTYLIQLELDEKGISIQGESDAAAKLVDLMEDSPVFKDVVFKSSLTKVLGTGYDRFHVAAAFDEGAHFPKPAPDLSEGKDQHIESQSLGTTMDAPPPSLPPPATTTAKSQPVLTGTPPVASSQREQLPSASSHMVAGPVVPGKN